VITALEMLHANLPPTLAKSQVSSVRKHLKNQLLGLLKHTAVAENFFTNITTLLTDLGASRFVRLLKHNMSCSCSWSSTSNDPAWVSQ
jgi:hypothetical protein